jgi:hypothetical protein
MCNSLVEVQTSISIGEKGDEMTALLDLTPRGAGNEVVDLPVEFDREQDGLHYRAATPQRFCCSYTTTYGCGSQF